MRKASLFSGIGGIDLAAHWAGMETVVFCEREPFPQSVLRKHWPDVPIIDDVRDFTRKELEHRGIIGDDRAIDLISAGYPCQPFSHAGKRGGSEDDRHLWPEVKRVLAEIRPRWFVGENVAGHITLGLDDVLDDLGGEGYTAQALVIPAAGVGAMHKRDRVFILGHTERSGRNRDERRRTDEEPANGYSELEGGIMADSPSERRGEAQRDSGRSEEWTASRDIMGNANGFDVQREQPLWLGPVGGRNSSREYQRASDGARQQGPTQSRVGRGPYEFSSWLDGGINPLDALIGFVGGYLQPAPLGAPQHDWEPPRVATGVKDRAARLKALGNAVDPLQILPIMYAIKLIDDSFHPAEAE